MILSRSTRTTLYHAMAATIALAGPLPAIAGIVLSKSIVDMPVAGAPTQDLEIWNDDTHTSYVVAEPAEIVSPGHPDEKRIPIVDPEAGGLLVTPQRLVLQPGERRLIRIAALAQPSETDRIFRVAVKPVSGPVTAESTALKLLVGYDVLVIRRARLPVATIAAKRSGTDLILHNAGSTGAELYDGSQCADAPPAPCAALPVHRLYADETWRVALPGSGVVRYRIKVGEQITMERW